jgi:hypothetical protein
LLFAAAVREGSIPPCCHVLCTQMAFKHGQAPHGFVLFSTPAHAHQALEAISGVPFEISVRQELHRLARRLYSAFILWLSKVKYASIR